MSTLLARRPRKSLAGAKSVSAGVTLEMVIREFDPTETYPALSDTTIRAIALRGSSDVSIADFAAVIRRDEFISAAVLRRANSCLYRGSVQIHDVSQAVVRLGLRECGKLICTIGVRAVYDRLDPEVRRTCEALHRHAVFVACLAAQMNAAFGLGHGAVAFTAGLMHDVGRVIACAKAPGRFAAADPLDHREDADLLRREVEHLGTDHCTVGHQFAVQNRLPDEIARVILNHHRPGEERLHPELVGLVATADAVANFAQREHKIAAYYPGLCAGYQVLTAGWTAAQHAGFRRRLAGLVVAALRETRAILKAIN